MEETLTQKKLESINKDSETNNEKETFEEIVIKSKISPNKTSSETIPSIVNRKLENSKNLEINMNIQDCVNRKSNENFINLEYVNY